MTATGGFHSSRVMEIKLRLGGEAQHYISQLYHACIPFLDEVSPSKFTQECADTEAVAVPVVKLAQLPIENHPSHLLC